MKTTISTCAPGPFLFGDGLDRPATMQWCNAHVAPIGSTACKRAAVTIDDEHPMYGTLATMFYPGDSYPYVVLGGSASGKTLVFACVDVTAPMGERLLVGRETALANARMAGAFKARQSTKNPRYYGDNIALGFAAYYQSREV